MLLIYAIDPANIKHVFMLCGTNDVENILHVQKNDLYDGNIDYSYFDEHGFRRTLNDIHKSVNFIHSWSINYQCSNKHFKHITSG